FLMEDTGSLDEGIGALTTASKLLPYRQDVAIDLVKLTQRRDEKSAAAPVPPEVSSGTSAPTPPPGSRVAQAVETSRKENVLGTDGVNALLAQGKEDEAVTAMENLVAHSHGESRAIYQD